MTWCTKTKTQTLFRHTYISQQGRKGFKMSWSNWFLCTCYRKVGSRVGDWLAAIKHKCTNEEIGRKKRGLRERERKQKDP